jgi:PPOX class probable F420-dependent enzyme
MNSSVRALFEAKNFAHLSVARRDGSIQTAVIWVHTDDSGNLIVNSAEGRAWPANLRREGRATVSVHNAENPYEFASIGVTLTGDTHEGADSVIDALAKKYMGVDTYPLHSDDEQRVTLTLTPDRVTYRGG